MEFYFVTLKSGGAVTIVDKFSKPRFMCFKETSTAQRYVSYLCEHKAKIGTWPSVNLSTPISQIRVADNHEEQLPDSYRDLLEIKYKTMDDLDNMSIMTGISYFYCHRFEYDNLTSLSISGQEIDGQVDDFLYREQLDYRLKNT
jgi:hypothetical protein